MSRSRVSVALCTCNGEKFIGEQLESIARQSMLPDEVVLCDDASNDRTLEIARQYEMRLPIRIIVNKQRLGTSNNFSQAIASCEGDVIFLCDQDDLWRPEKVEKTVELFADIPGLGLVFSDADLIDADNCLLPGTLWMANRFGFKKRKRFEQGNAFAHLLRSNIVTGATLAFKADFKKIVLPIPASWIHDYWIATTVAANSKIYCEPACLTQYRIHSNQQISIHRGSIQKMRNLLSTYRDLQVEKEKYCELRTRLETLERNKIDSSSLLNLLDQKLAHIDSRQGIVARRSNAISNFLSEVANGNYFKFSYGWIDIFCDILRRTRHRE